MPLFLLPANVFSTLAVTFEALAIMLTTASALPARAEPASRPSATLSKGTADVSTVDITHIETSHEVGGDIDENLRDNRTQNSEAAIWQRGIANCCG